MDDSCANNPLLVAVFIFAFGLLLLPVSALAWFRPNSWIVQVLTVQVYPTEKDADPISKLLGTTRERIGNRALWTFRFIGPVVCAIMIWVASQLYEIGWSCGIKAVDITPLFGPLEFRWWWPGVISVAIVGAFIFILTQRLPRNFRLAAILASVAWAIGGAEAAAFHTGPMAARWGLLSLIPFALAGMLIYLGQHALRKAELQAD